MFAVLLSSNKIGNHLLVLFGHKSVAAQKEGSSNGFGDNQLSKKDKPNN